MDIREFQDKLKEILELAVSNGKKIHVDAVNEFFNGKGLNESQIQKVYDYLAVQGIHVEGRARKSGESEMDTFKVPNNSTDGTEEAAAFTPEEEEYLEEYESSLGELNAERQGEREELFAMIRKGDEIARKRLTELYLSEVVKISKELYQGELFIGDMIAEGNIGLLTALESLEEADDCHAYICSGIRNSILYMLEEQTDRKQGDDILVERVRNLETKIKEILEDEESKYSIEELSAFLDMDVDEIQAVLRLTGEDK